MSPVLPAPHQENQRPARAVCTNRPRRRALAAGLALLGLSACASVDVPESLPGATTPTTAAAAPTEQVECGNAVASLQPDAPATADVAGDSYMAEIRERGRLRVGVDVATMLLGSVDPQTGDFEGFDVDIAREVAAALLPDVEEASRVEFVGIPSSDRVTALTGEGTVQVDMVASAFTITCARREDIAFSSEYYHAGQRVLVREDSPAGSVAEVGQQEGGTVCVSAGSTAIGNIEGLGLSPAPAIEPAPQRADCLVRLQQGLADAMATDDVILAGMAAQDPTLEVRGEAFSDEPYGLGLPPDRPEWVRYVNAVLEEVRDSGRWNELYDLWLADHLPPPEPGAPPVGPPQPVYED